MECRTAAIAFLHVDLLSPAGDVVNNMTDDKFGKSSLIVLDVDVSAMTCAASWL